MPEIYFELETFLPPEEGVGCRLHIKSALPLPKILFKTSPALQSLIRLIQQEEERLLRSLGKNAHPSYRLSCAKALSLLQEVVALGLLFSQGQNLHADFFSRGTLKYEVTTQEKSYQVIAKGAWGRQEFLLHAASLIARGTNCWMVHGIYLKVFDEEISWAMLRPFCGKPLMLNSEEKENFFRLYPNWIQNTEASLFEEKKISPTPQLLLKDQTGAFADLLFDYGEGRIASMEDHSSQVANPSSQSRCKRAKAEELHWERDLLESGFIKKALDNSFYYCPMHQVQEALYFLLECGWAIRDREGRSIEPLSGSQLSLEEERGGLSLRGEFRFGRGNISLNAPVSEVARAFKSQRALFTLSPTHVALMPKQFDERNLLEGEIVASGLSFKRNRLGELKEEIARCKEMVLSKEVQELFQASITLEPQLLFLATLRTYQSEGLQWLLHLARSGFHGILADEMGLGKTVQVIAFLSHLPFLGLPHLIVVPTTLLFHWRGEIARFSPQLSVALYHGSERQLSLALQSRVIITSYGTVRQDLDLFQQQAFHALILDEAHAIKNSETLIARAVCSLEATFRLSITGTPIENHFSDLLSQMRFLMPDLFTPEESGEIVKLKRRFAPFLLRRRKEEVAKDLPPKIEQISWVKMEPEQRSFYDSVLGGFKKGLLKKVALEGMQAHRMEVLEALLRLRQICCDPRLVPNLLANYTASAPASAKLELLLEEVELMLLEKRKILVYSQFTTMLQIIAQAFQERGWRYVMLTGATKNREECVQQFQQDPEIPLFLLSLKAGGAGLNLQMAEHVVLYDPWWNNAVEAQAIDRAHRIGQVHTVVAKRYLMRDTIEEKMLELKLKKESLSRDLFAEEGLTEEDLSLLLE